MLATFVLNVNIYNTLETQTLQLFILIGKISRYELQNIQRDTYLQNPFRR